MTKLADDPAGGGSLLAVVRFDRVRVLDVQTKSILCEMAHPMQIRHIEFSPAGRYLVTTTAENSFRVWTSGQGELLGEYRGHSQSLSFASFDSTGGQLVSASDDRTARIWTLESGADQSHFATTVDARQPIVQFDQDGRQLLVVSAPQTRTTVWRIDDSQQAKYTVLGRPRESDAASQRFVTKFQDQVIVRQFETGDRIATLSTHGARPREARISPEGRHVLVLFERQPAQLWAIDEQRKRTLDGDGNTLEKGAFHPTGEHVATGGRDGVVRVWHVESGQRVTSLETGQPILDLHEHRRI